MRTLFLGASERARDVPLAGGGGSAQYPNEPLGYTRAFEHDFQAFPSGSNGAAGTNWVASTANGGSFAIITDGTIPYGDSNAMRITMPSGMAAGISPEDMAVDQSGDTGRRENQYFSLYIKIDGANYENQSVGTKMGYFGYAVSSAAAMNQAFLILRNDGSSNPQTSMPLELWTQDPVGNASLTRNVGSGNAFTVGTWNHVELLMLMNTVGLTDGVFRMWVNGTQTHEYTNRAWRTAGSPLGWRGWKAGLVWGGTGGTRTRDDNFDFGHVYMSGTY